jgi:hypothetical protein
VALRSVRSVDCVSLGLVWYWRRELQIASYSLFIIEIHLHVILRPAPKLHILFLPVMIFDFNVYIFIYFSCVVNMPT